MAARVPSVLVDTRPARTAGRPVLTCVTGRAVTSAKSTLSAWRRMWSSRLSNRWQVCRG